MSELDVADHSFRLANSGYPYPYHYRAATDEIAELEVDAYPLGVRAEATYPVVETALQPGDYVVFCSDGIIEVANAEEDIFGFEQTVETIRTGCAEGLSAEGLIDRLVGAVQAFASDEPQGDDMTCVVLRVEG
jgi:sigma-B regulation protein RsbU (phosphoserine phosphatase)